MGDYPIVSAEPELKNFARNFLEFINALIQKTKDSILFDKLFTDMFIPWLSIISRFSIFFHNHSFYVVPK